MNKLCAIEILKDRFRRLKISVVLVLITECLALSGAFGLRVHAAGWTTNGPMITARYYHTMTLLTDGKVLAAGGYDANGDSLASAELFDPATGQWTETAAMNQDRAAHTATMLPNGQVLVAGGFVNKYQMAMGAVASAELFNPVAGTWTATSAMASARAGHTASLLRDGRVLVAGGYNADHTSTNLVEIYDYVSGSWTQTSPMTMARAWHTATLLSDGRVLVTGGLDANDVPLADAGLYDPISGSWTNTGSMIHPRYGQTATLLSNGLVLVAGGYDDSGPIASSELFDPSTGTWTETSAPLHVARGSFTAILLPNGQVLVTGGYDLGFYADPLSSVELYDPKTGVWSTNSPMTFARGDHAATLLANGGVLVAGGFGGGTNFLDGTEVYDYAAGTWSSAGIMNTNRSYHTATLLPDGKVLFAGNGGGLSSAELYDLASGTWTNTGHLNVGRGSPTAILLPNGKVLVAGGFDGADIQLPVFASAELYDPVNGTWRFTGSMKTARAYHTATLLPNGKVLIVGGQGNDKSFLSSAELYDPTSETWKSVAPMNTNRAWHTATLLTDGEVLVAGGLHGASTNYGTLDLAETFDPASGTWTTRGKMITPRAYHTSTLLPNGKVLVAGGASMFSTSPTGAAGMILSSAELFDPVAGVWTATGSLSTFRERHTATLLTDGKVLVAGNADYSTNSELFDPATGSWSMTGDILSARFNNTATLLPDGKVLIAGGNYAGGGQYYSSAEIYDPGFGYTNSSQPQITSVSSPLSLGNSMAVTGAGFRGIAEASSGSRVDSAADFPLVQLRSLVNEQTMFLLATNWSTNAFMSLPVWKFPPGYALATVFVNGIQSTSRIVDVSVPIPKAATLNNAVNLTNGFQFSFTNSVGALFRVLTTTNLSQPRDNWTSRGGVLEVAPGRFQFTDPEATNGGQRFYQVYSP